MHDIIEVIKNIQSLSENNTAFNIIKDFEQVIDQLDLYVFKNWQHGELCAGPNVERYSVTCSFMWPREDMPDPKGAQRLYDNGCQVIYKKEHVLIPRKIKNPDDYRPGTKKGKIDAHPVWVVDITIPKSLMQNIHVGQKNKVNNQMAELMKYSGSSVVNPTEVAQGDSTNA